MRARLLLPLLACATLLLGFSCGQGIRFAAPLEGQLSLTGPLPWSLPLPGFGVVRDIELELTHPDGSTTPVAPTVNGIAAVSGEIDLADTGAYSLRADVLVRFLLFNILLRDVAEFEVLALNDPDACEILNDTECLLPYPSSRFLREDAGSPTGYRLDFPASGLPQPTGTPIPVDPLNALDGFSPVQQVLMHFPGGVDLVQSGAPVLQELGCCGQPITPPWIETRTATDRSRESDSPTVLIDLDTGERILHFVELDERATDLARETFILRPGVALRSGGRYAVAVRNLVRADGSAVTPEKPFEALRDRLPSTIPALEARRDAAESLFDQLAGFGVGRDDLLLAFDFVVQSEHQLTHQMLTMRDKAFAWLDLQDQETAQTFTVDTVEDFDCTTGSTHRRIVRGTFQSPLFLEEVPTDLNVPQILEAAGTEEPLQNGTMDAPFTISIPCVLFEENGPDVHTMLLGHGIFGRGSGLVEGIPTGADTILGQFANTPRWNYIAGATDWTGWSSDDRIWVISLIVGIVNSQLHNFEAFPDRHRQGQTNTLILARMMKNGDFNADPAFQLDIDGDETPEGIFPGPATEMFYYGISMGGVQGLFHAALSPDIEKFGIDVGSINFSLLLQRSTQFAPFQDLLATIGLREPMTLLLGLGLLHELWVAGDPGGYARHITSDPLPGSGQASKVLLSPAWLDHQVSNQGTEITARTLGVQSLYGSFQQQLVDIPDANPGEALDSALVMYDTGLDITNPDHTEFIPPLSNGIVETSRCDPHGARPAIPAGMQQLLTFMQPGGQIQNFCDGICDTGVPFEIRNGDSAVCDPL